MTGEEFTEASGGYVVCSTKAKRRSRQLAHLVHPSITKTLCGRYSVPDDLDDSVASSGVRHCVRCEQVAATH